MKFIYCYYLYTGDSSNILLSHNYSYSPNDLTTSFRSRHLYPTCGALSFGCCEIYTDCHIRNDHVDRKISTINIYTITSNDSIQSNCPSLKSLVHLWNIHYQDENLTNVCDNTEYGCCPPIHTGCDSVFRIMKGENYINTVNKLKTFDRIYNPKFKQIKVINPNAKGEKFSLRRLKYFFCFIEILLSKRTSGCISWICKLIINFFKVRLRYINLSSYI